MNNDNLMFIMSGFNAIYNTYYNNIDLWMNICYQHILFHTCTVNSVPLKKSCPGAAEGLPEAGMEVY